MTNAEASTRTVIEHRFKVPCEEPFGGDWKDFGVALTWARHKAEELGINTDTDDWSSIHAEEEAVVIVLVERRDEEAKP